MQVKINVVNRNQTSLIPNNENQNPSEFMTAEQFQKNTNQQQQQQLIFSPLFATENNGNTSQSRQIGGASLVMNSSPITSTVKSSKSIILQSPSSMNKNQDLNSVNNMNMLKPIAVLSQVSQNIIDQNENSNSPVDNYYFAMSGPKTASTSLGATAIDKLPSVENNIDKGDFSHQTEMLQQKTSGSHIGGTSAATVTMIGNGGRRVRGVIVPTANSAMTTNINNISSNNNNKAVSTMMPTTSTEQQRQMQLEPITSSGEQRQSQIHALQAFVSMANTVNSKVPNRKIVSQDIRNHTQPLVLEPAEEASSAIALQPSQISKKRAMRTNPTARLNYATSLTCPQLKENNCQLPQTSLSKNTTASAAIEESNNFFTGKAAISPLGFNSFPPVDGLQQTDNFQIERDASGLNEDLRVVESPDLTVITEIKKKPSSKTRNLDQDLAFSFHQMTAQLDNENEQSQHVSENNNQFCPNGPLKKATPYSRAILGQDYNLTNIASSNLTQQSPTQNQQQQQRMMVANALNEGGLMPAASTSSTRQSQQHFQRRYTKGLKKNQASTQQPGILTASSSSSNLIMGHQNKENSTKVSGILGSKTQHRHSKRVIGGQMVNANATSFLMHQNRHQCSSLSSLSSVGSMIVKNNTTSPSQSQSAAYHYQTGVGILNGQSAKKRTSPPLLVSSTNTGGQKNKDQLQKKEIQAKKLKNVSSPPPLSSQNRPISPPTATVQPSSLVLQENQHSVLQITGFSEYHNSQKDDGGNVSGSDSTCSIAEFMDQQSSSVEECQKNNESNGGGSASPSMTNQRTVMANHESQMKKCADGKNNRLNVFQYVQQESESSQDDQETEEATQERQADGNNDETKPQEIDQQQSSVPQSPAEEETRKPVYQVEDLDKNKSSGAKKNVADPAVSSPVDQHQEMIKIQYPDYQNISDSSAIKIKKQDSSSLLNSATSSCGAGLTSMMMEAALTLRLDNEDVAQISSSDSKQDVSSSIVKIEILEQSSEQKRGVVYQHLSTTGPTGNSSTNHQQQIHQQCQKDQLTTTSRNSITMRESLDFAYSESGMQISSQQKSLHGGITTQQEGTINQTPSSIDFILTTKEENHSNATPQSSIPVNAINNSSNHKHRDALHSLASIQAYMQKQVSDFIQQPSCESQRLKKQLPVPSGQLSPSHQFLNQELMIDSTEKKGGKATVVVMNDKFNHYLEQKIDRQELRLCTPDLKQQKSRKKYNKTTLKLGGTAGAATVATSLIFDDDDEDIQLRRDPKQIKAKPNFNSKTAQQASENIEQTRCNKDNDEEEDDYCNIESLALKKRDTISLFATASPPGRRDHVMSESSNMSNRSFSGDQKSTPSDIKVAGDDADHNTKEAEFSPQIDSPTSSYFKTSSPTQNCPTSLLSPSKDHRSLSFKIKLLRMGDLSNKNHQNLNSHTNEDETTKDITTDQSSNRKSMAIATPYTSHFKFNKSIELSKSSSNLTLNTENQSTPATASPLWQQKSSSPENKNTLPKIFVPRSSQEGIQSIKEHQQESNMLITKDKFSRCSNFLKQKQPVAAPFPGSPDSKMVAISPSKQMLEAQSSKKNMMNPFMMSNNGGKQQTFMNTKPMFLGNASQQQAMNNTSRRRPSFPTTTTFHQNQNEQQNLSAFKNYNSMNVGEYTTVSTQPPCFQRRHPHHERLESLEMREAIYESHGIMSSDEKLKMTSSGKQQKKSSTLFGGSDKRAALAYYQRKAHSFAYETSSRADEKLTLPQQNQQNKQHVKVKSSDTANNNTDQTRGEQFEQLSFPSSPPLTVRNTNATHLRKQSNNGNNGDQQNAIDEQVVSDLKQYQKTSFIQGQQKQKFQSNTQRLNQLKTTKKEKEKSKGHSLLTLKRDEIVRVNSTRNLINSSPKFVQITKVKINNNNNNSKQKNNLS